jgi:hypothetical protein
MPPKKESPKDQIVEFGFPILVMIFIVILWSMILNYLFVRHFGPYASIWNSVVAWFMRYVWPIVIALAVIVSILAIIGIVRSMLGIKKLNEEERKIYGPTPESLKADEPVSNKNERWEHAVTHLNSANASDWRLAIIEADVMLDEMLRAQGYHGESIGEMLKGIEKSDMTTLDAAWEAHKVRNQIVHSGTEYYLTEREAKRIMALYESVFKEFKVI